MSRASRAFVALWFCQMTLLKAAASVQQHAQTSLVAEDSHQDLSSQKDEKPEDLPKLESNKTRVVIEDASGGVFRYSSLSHGQRQFLMRRSIDQFGNGDLTADSILSFDAKASLDGTGHMLPDRVRTDIAEDPVSLVQQWVHEMPLGQDATFVGRTDMFLVTKATILFCLVCAFTLLGCYLLSPADKQAKALPSWNLQWLSLTYRPEIDGLRVLAVVPIVLFHFQVGMPGGFIGVDVFFVISGYLITGNLVSDLQNERPLWQFWARRVQRLFPALAILLLAVLIAGRIMLGGDMLTSLANQVCAALLFVVNYHFYQTTDYFHDPLEAPLLHCWSLAVEEQFYFMYPWLLRCLWKYSHCWLLPSCVIAILVASFTTCLFVAHADSSLAFYTLPTRAWQFMLGAVALLSEAHLQFSTRAAAELFSWIGVGAIVLPAFFFQVPMFYPDYTTLLPCLGTAVFIVSQKTHMTFCGNVLAHRWIAFVGKTSYSLYLWHWPIYVFLCYRSIGLYLDAQTTALGLAISFFAAVLSYVFVEPAFRSESKVPSIKFLAGSAIVWVVLFAFASLLMARGDFQSPKDAVVCGSSPPKHTIGNVSFLLCDGVGKIEPASTCLDARSHLDKMYSVDAVDVSVDKIRQRPAMKESSYSVDHRDEPAIFGSPLKSGNSPDIVLIGSSFCLMFAELFDRLGKEKNKSMASLCWAGRPGHFDASSESKDWDRFRLSYIRKWQPETVIWIDFWLREWFEGVAAHDFVGNFSLLLNQSNKLKVFVMGQPPVMRYHVSRHSSAASVANPDLFIQSIINQFRKSNNSFLFLTDMKEIQGIRNIYLKRHQEIAIAASSTAFGGRTKFFAIDHFFINSATQKMMLIEPCKGTMVYANPTHLNADGADRVAPVVRKEIFGEDICGASSAELVSLKAAAPSSCIEAGEQIDHLYSVNAEDIQLDIVRQIPAGKDSDYTVEHRNEPPIFGSPLKSGKSPDIVLIGNSFCLMFAELFDRLAQEHGKSMASLCWGGRPGHFNAKPNSWSKDWDRFRLSYIRKWQPEAIIWIDVWHKEWYDHVTADDFAGNITLLMNQAVKLKVFVMGQPPGLMGPLAMAGDQAFLAGKSIMEQYEQAGNFNFLVDMKEDGGVRDVRLKLEAFILLATSNPTFQGRAKFLKIDQFYINSVTKKMMLISPKKGTVIFRTPTHLNGDGAARVAPLLKQQIFGDQAICNSTGDFT